MSLDMDGTDSESIYQWWEKKKVFEDGRVAYLHRTIFNLRISISPDEQAQTFDEFYCFHDFSAASKAMEEWDGKGDPDGWVRHVPTNRRRPDGDPRDEYIAR